MMDADFQAFIVLTPGRHQNGGKKEGAIRESCAGVSAMCAEGAIPRNSWADASHFHQPKAVANVS